MIVKNYGIGKWEKCLINAGETRDISFVATSDIEDEYFIKLVESACLALDFSIPDIADAFGEYWVCSFSQKIYGFYYRRYKNAREFLMAMDEVHMASTSTLENANPPRFDYKWENEKTLLIKYKSRRNLIDFVAGLVKGVGKYYMEDLEVLKIGNDTIKVIFP